MGGWTEERLARESASADSANRRLRSARSARITGTSGTRSMWGVSQPALPSVHAFWGQQAGVGGGRHAAIESWPAQDGAESVATSSAAGMILLPAVRKS